jgi:hypothetical protein
MYSSNATIYIFWVIYINSILITTVAFEYCSRYNQEGGICPNGNTCCPYVSASSDGISSYACIPNDLGSYNATCCNVVFDVTKNTVVHTGCPVGYICNGDNIHNCSSNTEPQLCIAMNQPYTNKKNIEMTSMQYVSTDPFLPILPRYQIYPCPQIRHVYGFSIQKQQSLHHKIIMYTK